MHQAQFWKLERITVIRTDKVPALGGFPSGARVGDRLETTKTQFLIQFQLHQVFQEVKSNMSTKREI